MVWYCRRELNNVLSVSGDEQFRSIILMLKIMEVIRISGLGYGDEGLGVGRYPTEQLCSFMRGSRMI